MHGYRADAAFDGVRCIPGGALVLVEDGAIVAVEPGTAPAPAGCPVTDLAGATLMPGLIDTHVHLCGDSGPRALDQLPDLDDDELDSVVTASLAVQLAAGVTAVRDLGDARWVVADRHRSRAAGPTVVAAGPPITAVGGHCSGMGGEATGVDGLRRAVRERVEHRVDVVKIMTTGGLMTPGTDVLAMQFTADELRVVVQEAHAAGLPVTAHAHNVPAIEACVDAGVDGIEHCTCITADGIRMPAQLAASIAAAGITVCPTLGTVPDMEPPPRVAAQLAKHGMTEEARLAQIGELHRAGVTLISGADAGINPSKRHGILPEGVISLVSAGLTPQEALVTATCGAAVAIGLEGRTGRLAPGLDADLLVIDGDPLTDITAVRDVRLVVSRGRKVSPETAG